MTPSGFHPYPVDLYRCLACGQEGLASAQDRLYCPHCGQPYPLLFSRAVDFIGPFTSRSLMLTPAQAIAHLPGFGWGYERFWRTWALSLLTGETFDAQREQTLLQDLLQNADPILDLGTTGGYWSRLVLQGDPTRTLIGMDLSPGVLEEADRQARSTWNHYSLMRAQAEQLPLASHSLGAVISGASLNEIPLEPALREIARVLKPGGVLVTLHGQQQQGWGGSLQQILRVMGLQFPSQRELQAALGAAGLILDRYLSFGSVAWVRVLRP